MRKRTGRQVVVLLLALTAFAALAAGCVRMVNNATGVPGITLPAGSLQPGEPSATPAVITATAPAVTQVEPATQPPAETQPPSGETALPAETTPPPAGATQIPTVAVTHLPLEAEMVLIAMEDNGASGQQVGCGDSAVPVRLGPVTDGMDPALFAVQRLLDTDEYFGESGLYNALHRAELAVDSLTVESGVVTLRLSGELMLGGVCDNPRVEAQLEGTLLANSNAAEAKVYVNGQPLEELLSGQ